MGLKRLRDKRSIGSRELLKWVEMLRSTQRLMRTRG
jgi:hypothetical protein